MNKKAITLICIFITLVSTQLACSFTSLISSDEDTQDSSSPDANFLQNPAQDEQEPPSGQDHSESQPAGSQQDCTLSFAGSTNISDGQAFQAGDAIQAVFTLVNTGTCTWGSGSSLIMVDGDLTPSQSELDLNGAVGPGESVQLEVDFTAPAQEGPYLSIWKMRDDGGVLFGQMDPPGAPLRVKVRTVPSGSPQPTPNPTQAPQQDQLTMLEGECFDFNSGSVVDCGDTSADFWYNSIPVVGGQLYKSNNNIFGTYRGSEPDLNDCENDSYAPLPHPVQDGEYLPFKIETIASTTYGWILVTHHNEDGLSFEFEVLSTGPVQATAVPNTTLFVESQGDQITLLEGECFDVWNGETNSGCSGIFAGFLFEEVTKKSLQVAQINPHEMQVSAAMTSKPTKSDCQNASYSTSPIWPIQETSYYCYQFVPGTTAYYGWLRPTSFNLNGMTFDFLTWESSP